jgi:NAD(P)-dependent dehydrogenase (short-subunit alcohol dehydrogenase family)|tara:strand:- start:452 stop:1249 length:798 start_codon:yes stop_codon:yes gene_type:complete
MIMELGLKGKVALITGGSEGIGKAAGMSMAAEGAKVAICARRQDVLDQAATEIREATGGEVLAISADVSDAAAVEATVARVVAEFGRLDILVNNAGASAAGPFESVTDEGWQDDLDLKLFGAIRACRLALPHMRAQGGGRIINVTNLGAKAPGGASVPTSVSRAAGVALTKAMSKEYAADNILVNTVCIGLIKSAQWERRYELAYAKDASVTQDSIYTTMGANVPLKRVGESEEAGDVIAFLASERASYLTGIAVNIDGGTSPVV